MASRFLQGLLSATVVAFIAVGCGNRGFNPPSDEDMIHNFYAHEDAFNEITEILLNCPYGDIYPPFYPIGSATDSLCLSSLGNEKCTRLDSLLASVGGRRLYFKSRHTLWQIEHGDFSSIPPIEELPGVIFPSISIIYYSAGWSVGPSVDKQYAYRFAEDSTYAVNWELNDLIELVRNDPDAPGGMASRHIEGDWYIELWYDK